MEFPLFINTIINNCYNLSSKIALINSIDNKFITYGELGVNIKKYIYWLRKENIEIGDRVVIAAARDFNFIYAYLALHSIGAVVIPLDINTKIDRYNYIRKFTMPKLSIWPGSIMPGSTSYPNLNYLQLFKFDTSQILSNMLSDIMFTSGTTGDPKGVLLTHGNIACSINNINTFIKNSSDDIEICPMPLSHSFGISRLRCVLYSGGTYIIENGVVNTKHLFESIEKYEVSGLSLVGPAWTMLRRVSGHQINKFENNLKYIELGSAPLTAKSKKDLADLLPKTHICMHYGLTEASRAAFLDFHLDNQHLDSVGKASPLTQIAIYSESGKRLKFNEEGEICVKGGMVTRGYLNQNHNIDIFWDNDFFRTGDIGKIDNNGYLILVGRIKEMINVGGEKVSPIEVESLINKYPGISESACVGNPDPILGETVHAFIVIENNVKKIDINNLNKMLVAHLETYKIPKKITIIDKLPLTSSGKIKRSALK